MEHLVTTADARTLRVQEAGAADGRAVLVHHGTPGSGTLYAGHVADAAQRGIRLIAYDRPGYGGSTPHPGRTVADCAADVEAVCDALDLERVAVWGISGGGPHALACAALLAGRVVAVASLASPAPYAVDGLDYFAGMGEENEQDTRLMLEDPDAARAKCAADREAMLRMTSEDMAKAFPTLVSAVDAAAMSPSIGAYLQEAQQRGLAPGDAGWWDDSWAYVQPWGFDLQSITMPVQVWHGRQDRFVPFQHGEWLARNVPGADARLLDDDGHITLINRVPAVHAWLLEYF